MSKPPPSNSGSAQSTLEKRLARLESAIKITDDGSVIIDSTKKISLKAAAIEIEGTATLLLKGGAQVTVRGGATLLLQGGVQASLKAAIVRLNDGRHPVAFSGSQVIPQFPPLAKVNQGNATVLV